MSFEGKIALVTGAAGGIGATTAKTLAARGAMVVVSDFDRAAGEAVAATIRDSGGAAVFRAVDVSEGSGVDALVDGIVADFGRLDLAHNNAGILHPAASFVDLSWTDWERSISINAMGVALCMRAELRHMSVNGTGAIVNTSSGAGLGAAPDLAAYVTSKHAVVGMTKSAAVEYAHRGVRVNAVAPGTVETAMTAGMTATQRDELNKGMPMGRMARAQEVAEVVVFLLSDAASYVNGVVVPIDGGANAHV